MTAANADAIANEGDTDKYDQQLFLVQLYWISMSNFSNNYKSYQICQNKTIQKR